MLLVVIVGPVGVVAIGAVVPVLIAAVGFVIR